MRQPVNTGLLPKKLFGIMLRAVKTSFVRRWDWVFGVRYSHTINIATLNIPMTPIRLRLNNLNGWVSSDLNCVQWKVIVLKCIFLTVQTNHLAYMCTVCSMIRLMRVRMETILVPLFRQVANTPITGKLVRMPRQVQTIHHLLSGFTIHMLMRCH